VAFEERRAALRVFFRQLHVTILANTLERFIFATGRLPRHVRFMTDYGFSHDTADVDWIERLAAMTPPTGLW